MRQTDITQVTIVKPFPINDPIESRSLVYRNHLERRSCPFHRLSIHPSSIHPSAIHLPTVYPYTGYPAIVYQLKLIIFFCFSQTYNLLYKLSNKQICCEETLVRSDHPMMILLCILYVMLCVRLLFFLSLVL
jgi:hypothetical protein